MVYTWIKSTRVTDKGINVREMFMKRRVFRVPFDILYQYTVWQKRTLSCFYIQCSLVSPLRFDYRVSLRVSIFPCTVRSLHSYWVVSPSNDVDDQIDIVSSPFFYIPLRRKCMFQFWKSVPGHYTLLLPTYVSPINFFLFLQIRGVKRTYLISQNTLRYSLYIRI